MLMSSKVDPLSNVGTSKVFLCIMKGKRNPKAMADFLGIKPPPVIQQLRRLQSLGVIELGEKEGKEQNYRVNWDNFLGLFIDRAMQKRKRTIKRKIQKSETPLMHADDLRDRDQIKSLRSNRHFKRLVQHYLQNVAESKPSYWATINYAIDNFENALLTSISFKRSKKFGGHEKQDFFNKMRSWYNRTMRAETWMDLNLHDAIYKTLKE